MRDGISEDIRQAFYLIRVDRQLSLTIARRKVVFTRRPADSVPELRSPMRDTTVNRISPEFAGTVDLNNCEFKNFIRTSNVARTARKVCAIIIEC